MAFRIGLVVTLALVAFGILYLATRDRWNWSEGSKTIFAAIAGLVLLPTLIIGFVLFQNRIIEINELTGVSLLSSPADVKFVLGKAKSETPTADAEMWLYEDRNNKGNQIEITFVDEQVVEIKYSGGCEYCNRTNGFGLGSELDEITKRLGQESNSILQNNDLERRIEYPKLNSFYTLQEGKVIRFGIFTSNLSETKIESEADSIEGKNTSAEQSAEPASGSTTSEQTIKVKRDLSQ